MPIKDTAAKLFFKNKAIAADICNAFIYGAKVVDEKQLHEMPAELYKIKDLPVEGSETDNRFRDMVYMCSMYTDKMAGYMFLCFEAQSYVDWKMPARVMEYEARQYMIQCEEELFKRFKKILPVITIVLNLSCRKWNGPKNLYDMLGNIDPILKKYISNYKINILDPHSMNKKTLDKFCTELRTVLNCFRYMNNKKRLWESLLPNSGGGCRLSKHAAVLLNKYLDTDIEIKDSEEEEIDMCRGMQELKSEWYREGLRKGRLEGRLEGKQEGRQEGRLEGILEGRQEGILEGKQEGILEGILEGKKVGMLKGKQEEKREIVEKALALGLSMEIIRKITGLSLKKIKEIRETSKQKTV